MCFELILMYVLISKGYASTEPCETDKKIDNWKRSTAYVPTDGVFLCDISLGEGWYRITSKAGERMPTECFVDGYKCGTAYPIYLSNEGIPTGEDIYPADGKVVNRTAYDVVFGNCKNDLYPISIKNCTLYLVYYLRPTTKGCDAAYCFGTELPCPDGYSSNTGFTPECSAVYPNITLTATLGVDVHVVTETKHNGRYISKSPKFVCSSIEATDDYTYNVNFYINDVLITGAKYINISFIDMSTASLLQEHWETTFKPNMMVKCSLQARYKDRGVAGDEHFSADFFAGIKTIDAENGIFLQEGQTKRVKIKSTLPIGCSYREGSEIHKDSCYIGLFNGVPNYQTTASNPVVCLDDTFVENNLEFTPQNCRLKIPHDGWENTHYINVTGVADGIVNRADRVVFLRLYTTLATGSKLPILSIWNKITLPDIKIYIADKEIDQIKSSCYSDNDPYLRNFDQTYWNFLNATNKGEYVLYKHERLPQQVNVYYTPCFRYKNGLCNCAVAVRSASSIFIVNFCETGPLANRKINRYITARLCDDQNLIVKETADSTYTVILPSGTEVLVRYGVLFDTDKNTLFSTISKIDITPSQLDTDLTTGLCGRFNGKKTDDFISRGNIEFSDNKDAFAKSWMIQGETDSFFNPSALPPITYKVQEYCTCESQTSITDGGQLYEPNYSCRLSDEMRTCRHIEIPSTVFHASCITSSHRLKRSIEEADESPPMYSMTSDAQVKIHAEPAVWRNGLSEETARQKCENSFNDLPAFEACGEYIPTVNSEPYVTQCISDMKITGSDVFLYSTLRNFETMCLKDAKKFENLTDTNTTGPSGESKSIYSVIAESTCPSNCSGKGSCIDGKCICIEGAYGGDCSLDICKLPRIIRNAFADTCDTSVKACEKFVVPGTDFISENLTCKFRKFLVIENSSYSNEAEVVISPGIYSNPFFMYCNLPGSRKRRSATAEHVASGYFISVSNNGNEFTEELTVILFDANCYDCNSTTFECIELDVCPAQTKEKKSESSMYIGIGVGIALTVVISLITGIFLLKKKINSRSTVADSRMNLPNPHDQYETASVDSLSNTREYSSLASSQIFMRETSTVVADNPRYANLI